MGAYASNESKIEDRALQPLRRGLLNQKVEIDGLPLLQMKPSPIVLEPFAVWAPGAKLLVHGPDGVKELDPPATRFYRGTVKGYEDSMAVFAVGRTVAGLVTIGDHRFTISPRFRAIGLKGPKEVLEESDVEYYVVRESTPADQAEEAAARKPWMCDVEDVPITPVTANGIRASVDAPPAKAEGISGTQSYAITLEVETDFELYQSLGSSTTNVQTYLSNLIAALSTIYSRDVHTNVTIANAHVYSIANGSPGGSPWTSPPGSGTLQALYQLGDYYHANYPAVKRSSVVLLSGRDFGGGVAWRGTICNADAFSASRGHYFGGYAFCSGIVPDTPTRLPASNIIEQGLGDGSFYSSAFTGNFEWVAWPLSELAHELGHNFGSPHTHCMTLTPAEQTSSGRSYVDQCYASESGCYGPAGSAETLPVELGTIMSYCHLLSPGQANSRFLFGKASEMSHHVLDDYLLNAAPSGFTTIVSATSTFSMSAITASSSVSAGSTGNAASITAIASATYAWAITNGTITGGQGTNAITYTAGPSGTVVLRVSAYGSNNCGVTDTKSVTIGAAVAAPTNLVATAATSTSVSLAWTASAGAASYNIYRSSATDYTAFAQVGTSATNSATDSNAVVAGKAYLYKVRAVNGGESADSNKDLATTIIFTDPTITAGSTSVKKAHIDELRDAVAAVRVLAVLSASTLTDPTLTASSTTIKRLHVTELRDALDAARTKMSLSGISYTDGTITAGTTLISKAHIDDLRNGVK